MPGFLEHRRQDVIQLAEASRREDFEMVREIGHGLKGAGGTYGLEAITAYGRSWKRRRLGMMVLLCRRSWSGSDGFCIGFS